MTTVAILGGGMGGLSVAHELVERGFDVTAWELRAPRGKARSIHVPAPRPGRPLPGEHGFRFFPGFYRHVPDTMPRIPVLGNANGVGTTWSRRESGRAHRGGRRSSSSARSPISTPDDPGGPAVRYHGDRRRMVPPLEPAFFVDRLIVLLTTCDGAASASGSRPVVGLLRAEGSRTPTADPRGRTDAGARGGEGRLERAHGGYIRGSCDRHDGPPDDRPTVC